MKAPLECLWKAARKPGAVVTMKPAGRSDSLTYTHSVQGGGRGPRPAATPAPDFAVVPGSSSHPPVRAPRSAQASSYLSLDQHPLPWVNSRPSQVSD